MAKEENWDTYMSFEYVNTRNTQLFTQQLDYYIR